jgi:cytochrome c-type biogenesis protein CcmH/NrfG
MKKGIALALAAQALAVPWLAHANDSGPAAPMPGSSLPAVRSSPPARTAEERYNQGRAFVQQKAWSKAEGAYREALSLRVAFPEAWNGLGYALRHQQKYNDALWAYEEALRLRPDYPEALEYLGEAYVQMGKMAEAQAILERLRRLDPREAEVLAKAIAERQR